MRRGWPERAARQLDLPVEAFGAARLTVGGRDRVFIENHRGLVAFSPQEVVVRTDFGRVAVAGRGLVLESLWPDRVSVAGRIDTIRFQE